MPWPNNWTIESFDENKLKVYDGRRLMAVLLTQGQAPKVRIDRVVYGSVSDLIWPIIENKINAKVVA